MVEEGLEEQKEKVPLTSRDLTNFGSYIPTKKQRQQP